MKNYSHLEEYFDNILSRTWLGVNNKTHIKIEKSEIESIYFEKELNQKNVILGKTKSFYFLLECYDSEGYKYANGLYNDSMVYLLNGYKDRLELINTDNTEGFVNSIKLNDELQKSIKENQPDSLIKLKKNKI